MAYCILRSYKTRVRPVDVFLALSAKRHCFFLDSSLSDDPERGRYSYIGADPFYVFQADGADPFPRVQALCRQWRSPAVAGAPPFSGGAVGALAYEAGFALEKKIIRKKKETLGTPEAFFAFYNTVIAFDHRRGEFILCAHGFPETRTHSARLLCQELIGKYSRELLRIKPVHERAVFIAQRKTKPAVNSNFTRAQYIAAVHKVKSHIKAGDVYQLNLSQRFETSSDVPAPDIYCRLRQACPAYFSAYFDIGGAQILSGSPERFVKVRGRQVSTRPMKGTRPRGASVRQDVLLKQRLWASGKDKAELAMIVDLERNDLGKVCAYDSVAVECARQLETYKTVHQTTATVTGTLHRGAQSLDLLRACFPGGSITGCPKVMAMQIIERMEPHPRHFYTGSLGYIDFSGNIDFNILIRTILKLGSRAYFSAGGGIVADSKPEAEYAETLVKARSMMQALQ